MKTDMCTMMLIRWEGDSDGEYREQYKERMDKNKPSEKLVEQTLELMKHQIELQRKDKKKC